MIYLVCGYIMAVTMVHILLFTKADNMSKILLINSAISCLSVAMLMLAYYFKDTNFIDVIFFYIIMSPIGFYGIFLYYRNCQPQQSAIINDHVIDKTLSAHNGINS